MLIAESGQDKGRYLFDFKGGRNFGEPQRQFCCFVI
jgi:hypothetical protein